MPIVRIEKPEAFIGMDVKAAQRDIAEHGYESRLVWVEGRTLVPDYMMGSKVNYDPLRINLWISGGKVTKVLVA